MGVDEAEELGGGAFNVGVAGGGGFGFGDEGGTAVDFLEVADGEGVAGFGEVVLGVVDAEEPLGVGFDAVVADELVFVGWGGLMVGPVVAVVVFDLAGLDAAFGVLEGAVLKSDGHGGPPFFSGPRLGWLLFCEGGRGCNWCALGGSDQV